MADQPRIGDVWESRDRQYEPGRRVRVVATSGPTQSNPCLTCETTTNPSRPERVGSRTEIRAATLARRWRLVERATAAEGGDARA